ncbi:MAG: fused MFS/spermidine synthase [Gammaproteobacteria bacterium]|nr:fused MFS/spermidine synthase [Gammaproteobacteria bacterium]
MLNSRYFFWSVFAISGFTGLIYETVWSHYLKLFLGHAAYAQALVLAIFMGGMAVGAWVAGRRTHRWRNLLLGYAVIEGLIGVLGLVFHGVFEVVTTWSYESVLPVLGTPAIAHGFRWLVAAALILPQSILLGMTFPLMSNAMLRRTGHQPGQSIAMLYFTNSIGAAAGALVAGFYLVAAVGLPGTILFAGIGNVLLGLAMYLVSKTASEKVPVLQSSEGRTSVAKYLLVAAFITGMASFIYEIAWLRMLSMVLGASTHSFELMLSAFILGLALGGFWVRRIVDRLRNPLLFAGSVQLIMGLLALLTLPLYNSTFDWMAFFMTALRKSEEGYVLFGFARYAIAALVMLPATFMAGMTLPLFTYLLMRRGYGEGGVGYIYASNTLGSIAGVVFALSFLPLLGLKGVLLAGVGLDVVLGLALLALGLGAIAHKWTVSAAATAVLMMTSSLSWANLDPLRMSSGVYRTGRAKQTEGANVVFHEDGRTASVTVLDDRVRIITTNGKPDASINMQEGPATVDEITMIFAAALPLSINPAAQKVANIGLGSGLTTHTALTWPSITQLDTVEIEPEIVSGARNFLPVVDRAFNDPRSHIYIEDAKTFFSTRNESYDLIISEPSNPWVSGVSSLFTDEFYQHVVRFLNPGGLFVQWINLYEMDSSLVFSIQKALLRNFADAVIYVANDSDMIMVASADGPVGQPRPVVFENAELASLLARVNLNNINDFHVRYVGDRALFAPFLNASTAQPNSDYFPYVDLLGERSRFLGHDATSVVNFQLAGVPIARSLSPSYPPLSVSEVSKYESALASAAREAGAILKSVRGDKGEGTSEATQELTDWLLRVARECSAAEHGKKWIERSRRLMGKVLSQLDAQQLLETISAITPTCRDSLDPQQIAWLTLYEALVRRDAQQMVQIARGLYAAKQEWTLPQRRFLFRAQALGMYLLGATDQAAELLAGDASKELFGNKTPLSLGILEAHVHAARTKRLANGSAVISD